MTLQINAFTRARERLILQVEELLLASQRDTNLPAKFWKLRVKISRQKSKPVAKSSKFGYPLCVKTRVTQLEKALAVS